LNTYYIDGNFVSSEEASIPLSDLAVLRGYAVFDFLRTYNGKPFHLEDHVDRLYNSGGMVGLKVPLSKKMVIDIVHEVMRRNNCNDANIRLIITGGDSSDNVTPDGVPRLIVMLSPVKKYPLQWYTDGVKIITSSIARALAGVKSTNYIIGIIAQKKARNEGAVEAIYVDKKGNVQEGTTSNIFMFKGKKLITPVANVLPGITRQVIIDLTKDRFDIKIQGIKEREILKADEVFICSSNKEIVPVVKIDDKTISKGKVGDRTRIVMELFYEYTKNY
jgi:branched-chain amino acid aminotransferase